MTDCHEKYKLIWHFTKSFKRDQNWRWRRNQSAGRHREMFFVFKCDMILTILLSATWLVSTAVCINQVLVLLSLPLPCFYQLHVFFLCAIDFDIYVIICLFKMSTRFFMILVLRVNCTTNKYKINLHNYGARVAVAKKKKKKRSEKQIRKKR